MIENVKKRFFHWLMRRRMRRWTQVPLREDNRVFQALIRGTEASNRRKDADPELTEIIEWSRANMSHPPIMSLDRTFLKDLDHPAALFFATPDDAFSFKMRWL